MTTIQYIFTFALYLLGACILTTSLVPPVLFFLKLWEVVHPATIFSKSILLSMGVGFGYFMFGLTLVLQTVILKTLFNLNLEEGEFSYFSSHSFKWAFVNSLVLIVNITFMDFMKLTPLLPLYYRMMGAKIGKRVQINTKHIADASLLEIGDDSIIGGDVVMIGHLAEHGKLVLKKTKIGKRVTVGLGSVVMPGTVIGDGALIAAKSLLLKYTQVPERSLFAGTPAKYIHPLTAP